MGGDPLAVFQVAAAALKAQGPTALVVDDAHQLDDLSAALLLHLVATGTAKAVITVRAGLPVPDAVATLWKDGYLDRLDVAPLSDEATVDLITAVLGTEAEPSLVRRFTELSQGNPLYLSQIVLGELRAGRLAWRDGRWTWDGDFRASAELVELVDRAALSVPERTRHVLDVLAVAGDLELDVLLRCADPGDVESAEQEGLITLDPGQPRRARPSHPLYAEVRRARIGELAARRIRGIVAAALSPEERTGAARLRRAALLLDSDRAVEPEVYARAAEQAVRLFDYPLGERLAAAAVEAGGGFETGLLLAFAQGWSNQRDSASSTYARLVRAASTDVQRLRSTVGAAGHTFYMCARPDDGLALLDAGRRAISDPSVAVLLDAVEAWFSVCLGRPVDAVRLARAVMGRGDLPPQLEVSALFGLVNGLGLLGHVDVSIEHADRAWTVGSAAFDAAHMRLGVVFGHVCSLVAAGYLERAEELAGRRSDEISPSLGDSSAAAGFWGAATLASGQVERAAEQLDGCCAALRHDTTGWRYNAAVFLARALALAGRVDDAVAAAALVQSLRHPAHLWLEPERLLTSAWVSAAQGAVSEAVTSCHAAARWARLHQQHAHVVLALQTAARFGDSSGAAELQQLVSRVDGPRVVAAASHAGALAKVDPDALLRSAEQAEAMGDRLAAADAYAQAAVLLAAQSRMGSRALAMKQARTLQQACGAVTPALRAGLHPLPLGLKDREVATMAAYGLTNRVIAERLHLSVRTVEGHLYRTFGRLGLRSRSDLPDALQVTVPSGT